MSLNSIEKIWDALLSRDSSLIQKTFIEINENEQKMILDHLKRMSLESGWHLQQKISAQAAIDAINEMKKAEE